jgi:serine protease Do
MTRVARRSAAAYVAAYVAAQTAVLVAAALTPVRAAGAQRPPAPASAVPLAGVSAALEALAARASPAVVQIVGTGAPDPRRPLGAGGALGSGFVVDAGGYVVTNAHVVRGATRLSVLLAGAALADADAPAGAQADAGPRVRRVPAEVVGADDETDVALLRLDLTPTDAAPGRPPAPRVPLPVLPFADSDALRPGQLVLAVGSPLGLKNSVSLGVVSAVERQLDPDRPQVYVQTDAPINPGSSGGPLVDAAGRVVGLGTFILTRSGGSEGLGFAVPANTVRRVADQLRKAGRVRRGTVGVAAQTITPALGAGLGLARAWGVILSDVLPGGPAHAAGLRVGDRVLAVDGRPVAEAWQLEAALDVRAVGEAVRLRVLRTEERPAASPGAAAGGVAAGAAAPAERVLTAAVTVAERADAPDWLARVRDPGRSAVPELGVVGLDLAPDDPEAAPLLAGRRVTRGVLVAALLPGAGRGEPLMPGAADEGAAAGGFGAAQTGVGTRGLERGDVIRWVAGRVVASVADVRAAVADVLPGEPIVAHVDRGGRLHFVVVERP